MQFTASKIQQITRMKRFSPLLSFNNLVKHTNNITIKGATSSHADCHGKLVQVFSKNCRANTIRNKYFLFCRFGVQTPTKTKFDWRRFRYFSAKLVCVISKQGHILPWIASGSVFYYFCFKHIGGIFFARALQCAKCETAHGFPSTAYSVHDASSDDKRSFVKRLILHYIPILLRATQLLFFFTPLLITYPLTYLGPSWFEVWLHVLYVTVEYSGATFIKLGQWASTRRDLFSKQVCDKFAHLHFQVRPHVWSHTAGVLKEAYGDLWQEMLHLSDGQKPIGSGCIAQVYKGYISEELAGSKTCENNTLPSDKGLGNKKVSTLKDTLSIAKTNVIPVAIKVLHPSIQDTFKRDMILMMAAAQFLTWLFPKLHWINLSQCVQEFKVVMQAQLDMRQECLCLQRFTEDFASFNQIRVPEPFPDLVRHNVLVETFEEGISIGQIVQDINQPAELKVQLADIGVDILLQMVFVNNFVHADLHPGNLIVQNIDKFHETEQADSDIMMDRVEGIPEDYCQVSQKKEVLRLVLLDCGITSSLGPEDRKKFQEVFTAVVKGEGETVADLFLSKSAVNNCRDPALFRIEMAQLVKDARQNLISISKIKVAELMNAVFAVLSRHQIQLEANFATIILAMAMLEGLGRSLNPNLDLLEKARPVLLSSYLSDRNAGS